jgi:hypothetical protein
LEWKFTKGLFLGKRLLYNNNNPKYQLADKYRQYKKEGEAGKNLRPLSFLKVSSHIFYSKRQRIKSLPFSLKFKV